MYVFRRLRRPLAEDSSLLYVRRMGVENERENRSSRVFILIKQPFSLSFEPFFWALGAIEVVGNEIFDTIKPPVYFFHRPFLIIDVNHDGACTIDIEPTHLRISSWSIGSARFPIRRVGRSPPDKFYCSLAHLLVASVTSWENYHAWIWMQSFEEDTLARLTFASLFFFYLAFFMFLQFCPVTPSPARFKCLVFFLPFRNWNIRDRCFPRLVHQRDSDEVETGPFRSSSMPTISFAVVALFPLEVILHCQNFTFCASIDLSIYLFGYWSSRRAK